MRAQVCGTAERPRLNVSRSIKHMYAQVIDDALGNTMAAASTLDPELRQTIKRTGNVDAAREVGRLIAVRAAAKGISAVVFDRGGYLYHGRVQALADGAREGGLRF